MFTAVSKYSRETDFGCGHMVEKNNLVPKISGVVSDRVFGMINALLLTFCLIVVLYPLYFVLIASLSDPYAVGIGKVIILPHRVTLEGYQNILKKAEIWTGYRNTIFYTSVGTLFNLFLTIPAGYSLSKKHMPFRTTINIFLLITMFFGGGLIPFYLLVRDIGLYNKPYTLIFLGGVSVFYIIVTRTYFQSSIPEELYEAAFIDGASEMRVFFSVAVPLAKPIVAVMALYYAVGHWNDYFSALIFVSQKELQPLQLILRSIILQAQVPISDLIDITNVEMLEDKARLIYMAQTMKYAMIFIASAPMLIMYPFVQKYFVKGVMLGSLKG